jgi:hypothetical protein
LTLGNLRTTIATFSPDILGRIILMTILEDTLRNSHDWAIDRIHSLCEEKNYENAQAIQSEFSEWLNPDIPEHDIFSLDYIGEENDFRSS